MNRPIRFYVWHKGRNEWLHGSGVCGGCNILGETILLGGWCRVSLEELNDLVVLQYTGLDVGDHEIYEGDILNTKAARWEVVFHDGAFVAKVVWSVVTPIGHMIMLRDLLHNSGIIPLGNRWENPDLLEFPQKEDAQ